MFKSPGANLKWSILVTPPMPVLEVVFHSFPSDVSSGEVTQCILEVNNKGTMGLKDLVVKSSYPTNFQFGDPSDHSNIEYCSAV
jgi:trafficking protein particle complex subunit 8